MHELHIPPLMHKSIPASHQYPPERNLLFNWTGSTEKEQFCTTLEQLLHPGKTHLEDRLEKSSEHIITGCFVIAILK